MLRARAPRAVLPAPGPASRHRCGTAGPEEGEAAELLAMGFSQAQARRLRLLRPGLEPQRRAEAAAQLLLLGLSAEAALGLLERSPGLLRMETARLKERAEYLRRLGLEGGRAGPGREEVGPGRAAPPHPAPPLSAAAERGGPLPRGVHAAPAEDGGGGAAAAGAVSVHGRAADRAAAELPRGAAGGAGPRAAPLPGAGRRAGRSGGVAGAARPALSSARLHAQYAYFRMGVRQKEMVKARLFRTPFAELRNRHVFLERRGLYRTPHKGQSQSGNPALRDVLRPTEGDFVAGVARASPDEYEVFKRLLAREEEEMEEEDEEDEEEEEEGSAALHAEGGDRDWHSSEPSPIAPCPPAPQ